MDIKSIAKQAGTSSLATLETLGGFVGANAVSKVAKVNSLVGTLMILIAGIGIAVFAPKAGKGYVFEKMIPNMAIGMATFGGIKTLNVLSGDIVDSGVKGIGGFTLPESVRSILKSYVPQLSGGSPLYGYMGNERIELTQNNDGSWSMKGLGNPGGSIYTPDIQLGNPYNASGVSDVLDLQVA